MHRQAMYVAASRAAEATRFYGTGVVDADEVERLDARPTPAPDPDDVEALAAAMRRDATQAMASAQEPDAAEVGRLMGMPPAWLWAEHAAVAARVGARPPLAESLRRVRSALATTYGIDSEALECRRLEAALTRALQVPGATPEAITAAKLARGRAGVRELDSAGDPVAVLVWAADAAAQAMGRSGPAAGDDHRRLELLDAAIARQRHGRLALAETEASGPLPALLGSPPASGAALVAWRRAAAAVLDYRDTAGIFDRERSDADPWRRALGDATAAYDRSHYDQVRRVVVEGRAAMVVADLGRHVPLTAGRPRADVESLAQRPLRELRDELDALARHRATATRRAVSVRAAERELERARQALGDLVDTPASGRRRGRPRPAEAVAAQARARAEQRVVEAGRRWTAAVEVAGEAPARLPERIGLLSEAVAVREARLRAGVLSDPPDWARRDLSRRVDGSRTLAPATVQALARAYGDVVVFADRWGTDARAASIDEVLGERPPSPEATQPWLALRSQLRSPGVVAERGVDLGL
jgi:hypothetical protein